MVVLDRSGTGVQIVVKSLLLFSSLFSLIKEKGPSAVVGNKHVKNAVGAQSGEDSLRASHLKGGACPPLTIKKERFRGKERDFTTNLVLSFFLCSKCVTVTKQFSGRHTRYAYVHFRELQV